MISAFPINNSSERDLLFPQVIFAYRTVEHSSIGMSPFQEVYRQPILPGCLILGNAAFPPLTSELTAPEVLQVWAALRQKILGAQAKQKSQFDKRAVDLKLKPKDMVMLRRHVRNKLHSKFNGPYQILYEGPSPDTWYLAKNDGKTICAHAENIKLYQSFATERPEDSTATVIPDPMPSMDAGIVSGNVSSEISRVSDPQSNESSEPQDQIDTNPAQGTSLQADNPIPVHGTGPQPNTNVWLEHSYMGHRCRQQLAENRNSDN